MKDKGGNWLWNWMAFVYDQFYKRFPPYLRLHQEILKDFKKPPPDLVILDAGCGTGLLSAGLARRGYLVVGIDRSPAMLEQAQKKRGKEGLKNLIFLESDLSGKLDLQGYSFHRIFFIHSLYLLNHPQVILRNIASVLSPGGEVIMCNPRRKLTHRELCSGGISFLREATKEGGIFLLFIFVLSAIGMGILNIVIQRQKQMRIFHCWNEKEIVNLLKISGFRVKWLKESCLAHSHLLLCAVREE